MHASSVADGRTSKGFQIGNTCAGFGGSVSKLLFQQANSLTARSWVCF